MSHNKTCEAPFWKDGSVLFKEFTLQYKPTCEHSAGNFIARIIILSVFVGCIGSVFGGLPIILVALLFGGITAFVIVSMTPFHPHDLKDKKHDKEHGSHTIQPNKKLDDNAYHTLPYEASVVPGGYLAPTKEHFVNGGSAIGSAQPIEQPVGKLEIDGFPYSGPALPDYTPPTSRNLFMNVLVDEMKYNPERPSAAPVDHSIVKQTMDDYFRVQWFSDPTDVFGKNQGQRQFVTQPSTTVPNDQGSFANWLYKIPGKTCKEGGRAACLSGTDSGNIPWLNHTS